MSMPTQQTGTAAWWPVKLVEPLAGRHGLAGRMALSWAIAGGFLIGGVLVVAAVALQRSTPDSIPLLVSTLFAIGATGGFLHGAILGVLGRPLDVGLGDAVRGVEYAMMWAVPALFASWIAALWMAMASVAVTLRSTSVFFVVAAGMVFCLISFLWAGREAVVGLRYAMERWPEHRPGSVLVVFTFGVLAVAFVILRPEIWWTDVRVSGIAAVVLALGATFWIALPVLVLTLRVVHRWTADSPIWDGGPS